MLIHTLAQDYVWLYVLLDHYLLQLLLTFMVILQPIPVYQDVSLLTHGLIIKQDYVNPLALLFQSQHIQKMWV